MSVSVSASAPTSDIEQIPATKAESQLSAEFLYDILVAFIAAQRNERKLALESLSRAAYRSADARLITNAIQFSLNMQAYQHAQALAQFFNRLQPNNPTAILALAKAQFKLGDSQSALLMLTDLVKNKTDDDVLLLQDIATLLSEQNQDIVLAEMIKQLEKMPANSNFNSSAQLTLTAALLASKLGNADEYIRLLNDTLELKADWEAVGILKLIALSDHDVDSLNRFATTHLNRYPKQSRFRLQYARVLIQQHDTDSALTYLKQILLRNPDSADALFTASILYLDKNLLEKAKKMLVRYLALNANNQNQPAKTQGRLRDNQSRIYLAEIELKLKNYAAAASYLHGISSPKHYLDAQIKMGWVIARRDDIDSALAHLR